MSDELIAKHCQHYERAHYTLGGAVRASFCPVVYPISVRVGVAGEVFASCGISLCCWIRCASMHGENSFFTTGITVSIVGITSSIFHT